MAARKPESDKRTQILRAATDVFSAREFHTVPVDDVATAAGVGKGTLYLYVESKEALFDLVCRHADQPPDGASAVSFPVRSPKPGATLRYVRDELQRHRGVPALLAARARRRTSDVAAEIGAIVGELYDMLAANRRRIKLIDKSARDYPELAQLWFAGARSGVLELLADYLRVRIARGSIPPSWSMRPTRARSGGPPLAGSVPRTETCPPSRERYPSMISTVVVLPAPFGPRIATSSPAPTVIETPSTTARPP